MDRVDNSYHERIDGQAFGCGGHPGAGALGNQHELPFSGPQHVDRHERAPVRYQAFPLFGFQAVRFDHQLFVPAQRLNFLRRDQGTGNFGNEHGLSLAGAGWTAIGVKGGGIRCQVSGTYQLSIVICQLSLAIGTKGR